MLGSQYISRVCISSATFSQKEFTFQWHHNELMSQITGISIVCSTVCLEADKRKQRRGDRWTPLTMGQYLGKCFHLMTSSSKAVFLLAQRLVTASGRLAGRWNTLESWLLMSSLRRLVTTSYDIDSVEWKGYSLSFGNFSEFSFTLTSSTIFFLNKIQIRQTLPRLPQRVRPISMAQDKTLVAPVR